MALLASDWSDNTYTLYKGIRISRKVNRLTCEAEYISVAWSLKQVLGTRGLILVTRR